MTRNFVNIAVALVVCAAAPAATISTTLSVSATATLGATVTATGTATLTGIGSGTFSGTISTATFSGPYAITIGSNTITGTITVDASILTGTGTAVATVTGGTGTYAGATGSFPNLAGAATGVGTATTFALTFNGPGTITTGGTVGPTPPAVTGILNNYSFIQPGFPNYGIAPGSLFIIQGSGLADPTAQAVLQSSAAPGIPKTLNGASVSVTVNGTTVQPALYYAIATQLAAVLPASTPVGTGTLTVTYNSTPSATFPIQAVQSALGFGTYGGSVIATNPTTGVLYSYTNSAKPGETIVLWGSGLGAISADSDTIFSSPPHPYSVFPTIYIGGVQANVLYAGDSGYPGVNQINVTIPTTVSPGCNVSLIAVSGSGSTAVSSNSVALSVATGGGACSDPAFGITGANITTLSGQSTVKTGTLIIEQLTTPASSGTGTTVADVGLATFQSVTGASFTGSAPSIGSCSLSQTIATGATKSLGLDAGSITLTGANSTASFTSNPVVAGSYLAQLASGFIPSTGGSFTFTGTGGADVGSFHASVTFPNPLLTWTNTAADATITRSSGAQVTWTGGASGTYVLISGSSTSGNLTASFNCYTTQSALQFTVPAPILLSLPAGTGSLLVENATNFQSFTASGLDSGAALGAVAQQINATYK
jgi:uncharacterized protein (TIGR03437 family)